MFVNKLLSNLIHISKNSWLNVFVSKAMIYFMLHFCNCSTANNFFSFFFFFFFSSNGQYLVLAWNSRSKKFKIRNGTVAYMSCNQLSPLRRHWHRSCKRSRQVWVIWIPDDFLLSYPKQVSKIYSLANIYCRIAWIIHLTNSNSGIKK